MLLGDPLFNTSLVGGGVGGRGKGKGEGEGVGERLAKGFLVWLSFIPVAGTRLS